MQAHTEKGEYPVSRYTFIYGVVLLGTLAGCGGGDGGGTTAPPNKQVTNTTVGGRKPTIQPLVQPKQIAPATKAPAAISTGAVSAPPTSDASGLKSVGYYDWYWGWSKSAELNAGRVISTPALAGNLPHLQLGLDAAIPISIDTTGAFAYPSIQAETGLMGSTYSSVAGGVQLACPINSPSATDSWNSSIGGVGVLATQPAAPDASVLKGATGIKLTSISAILENPTTRGELRMAITADCSGNDLPVDLFNPLMAIDSFGDIVADFGDGAPEIIIDNYPQSDGSKLINDALSGGELAVPDSWPWGPTGSNVHHYLSAYQMSQGDIVFIYRWVNDADGSNNMISFHSTH